MMQKITESNTHLVPLHSLHILTHPVLACDLIRSWKVVDFLMLFQSSEYIGLHM